MLLQQRGRNFFYLLKIYFVTFFNYTGICTLIYVAFVLTKEVFKLYVLVCVLNPRGLEGYLKFELSYAKTTRRLVVVFVVILDQLQNIL